MSNDDALISKLISETYTDSFDKDQPNAVSDLRNYFEKKLNEVEFISVADYLNQHGLKMSPLTLHNNHCYRLVYNKSVLDFPKNWSIFKDIKNEDLIFVDQSLDQDFLLDIFSEVTGEYNNLALIKESMEVKLIFLPEMESKEHIQWFRGFFEKKKHVDVMDSILKENSESEIKDESSEDNEAA
jgi:hypothetical protein